MSCMNGAVKHTLGAWLDGTVLLDVEAFAQLTDDAAIFLIHKHNSTAGLGAAATLYVALTSVIVSRVVWRQFLASRFTSFGFIRLAGSLLLGRRSSFEERGALRKNGLKRIEVFLNARAAIGRRELNACECSAVSAEVPSRDQVAAGRLVIDLGRCRQRKVELRGQMQVQVEVFFSGTDTRRIGKSRRCWHHQQGQRLGSGRGERLFVSIGDVVGIDAVDRVEKLWIL